MPRSAEELATTLEREGISDPRVLAAIRSVPRELFVDEAHRAEAYANHPLSIGCGQTISQPYIVALMSELLQVTPGERILEIGTGSGYQAAVLARMGCAVHTVELVPALADRARLALQRAGIGAVHQHLGDGHQGWRGGAPYDGIIVTAATRHIPEALPEQLAPGARLVVPVGPPEETQTLAVLTRGRDGEIERRDVATVRFVPLVHGPAAHG